MSNMTEERTIQVDEVQAAIDLETGKFGLEIDKLKKAMVGIIDEVSAMADHMNETFTRHNEAIRETMDKHNGLAQMVIALGEFIKKFDCVKPEEPEE